MIEVQCHHPPSIIHHPPSIIHLLSLIIHPSPLVVTRLLRWEIEKAWRLSCNHLTNKARVVLLLIILFVNLLFLLVEKKNMSIHHPLIVIHHPPIVIHHPLNVVVIGYVILVVELIIMLEDNNATNVTCHVTPMPLALTVTLFHPFKDIKNQIFQIQIQVLIHIQNPIMKTWI